MLNAGFLIMSAFLQTRALTPINRAEFYPVCGAGRRIAARKCGTIDAALR